MKTKTVSISSILPADVQTVWKKLQQVETLQYITKPIATFSPCDSTEGIVWKSGETCRFSLKICGIPFGVHTIAMRQFDKDALEIYTTEHNRHVPIWNHRIHVRPLDNGGTQYSDIVEIGAGWKTAFVCQFATFFYKHRQKRWRTLLNNSDVIA